MAANQAMFGNKQHVRSGMQSFSFLLHPNGSQDPAKDMQGMPLVKFNGLQLALSLALTRKFIKTHNCWDSLGWCKRCER